MKIEWNSDKDALLRATRNVSFEMVLEEILLGHVLENNPHPNQEKYPAQFIFVVMIEGYCYVVPYVKEEDKIFLKTIFPSRKMTKKYRGGSNADA